MGEINKKFALFVGLSGRTLLFERRNDDSGLLGVVMVSMDKSTSNTLDLQSDEYNIGQNRITPLRFIVAQATDMSNLNVEDDKYNLRHFISENNNGLENVSNLRIHVARESLDGKLSYNCVRRSFAVIDDVFDILYTTSQSSKRDIFWNSENSSIEIKRLFYSKIRHIYGCLGNIFETSLAGTPMSPLPYDLEIILDNSQERNSFPKVHLRGHLHTSMTILSQWRLKEEAESLLGEHRDESPSVRCTQWLLSLCASGFLSQLPSDSDFIPQRQKESFLERQQLRYKALVELCTSASVLIELDSLISDLRLPIRKHAEVLAVAFRLSSSRLSLSDINMQSTEKPVEQWLSAIEAWVDDESNLPFTEFTQHNIQEIFCSVLQQTEEDLNDWICLFNTIPSNTNNIFSFMDTSIYKLGTTDDKYTHRVRIRISCDVDQSLQLVSNRSLGIPKSILFQRHWCPPMARSVSKRDYFISLTPSPGNVEIRFVLKNLEISDELKSQEILSDLKDVRNLITRIKARAQISNIKPTTQSVVLVVLSPIDTLKLARVVALSCPLNTLGKSRSYFCDTVKEEDILVPDRLNFGKLHFINSLKHVSALQTMWNWLKLSTTEAITSYEIQNAQEELYDVVTDGSGMYRLISTKAVSLYSLLTSRTIAARKIAELTGATVYALASFVIVRRKQAFAVDLKTKKNTSFL